MEEGKGRGVGKKEDRKKAFGPVTRTAAAYLGGASESRGRRVERGKRHWGKKERKKVTIRKPRASNPSPVLVLGACDNARTFGGHTIMELNRLRGAVGASLGRSLPITQRCKEEKGREGGGGGGTHENTKRPTSGAQGRGGIIQSNHGESKKPRYVRWNLRSTGRDREEVEKGNTERKSDEVSPFSPTTEARPHELAIKELGSSEETMRIWARALKAN